MYYLKSRFYKPEWHRFLTPDSLQYLDIYDLNGINLYTYCNNNPVMNSDGDGRSPEWWQWVLSGAAVIAGIALSATGVGGILGGVLIGAGAGSMINGYVNEANGGSFTAGYWGGAISGALCGIGAGLGGLAFSAASKAVNFACMGYSAIGIGASFAGGFLGNMFGVMTTAKIDGTFNDINWSKTAAISAAVGGLNVLAGMASGVGSIIADYGKRAAPSLLYIANIGKYTNTNVTIASRLVAGGIASVTEGIFDVISYLIGLL